jgi:hypothetical protein
MLFGLILLMTAIYLWVAKEDAVAVSADTQQQRGDKHAAGLG